MEYYELLGVRGDATELDLKKAYRKAAVRNHPDKGGDEETFKMIGEAYRVLSDSNARADYDRYGKKYVRGAPRLTAGSRPTRWASRRRRKCLATSLVASALST